MGKIYNFINIHKKIFIAIFLVFYTFLLFGYESSNILKVGVLENFPPQYLTSEKGDPSGFAVDVIEAVAERAGFTLEYVVRSNWLEVSDDLETGKIDIIPNSGITERRKNIYSYTIPVETFPVHVFTRKSYEKLSGLDDLKGKRVAVVKRNIGEVLIKDIDTVSVRVFDHVETALFDLLSGNSDAFIFPKPVLLRIARNIKVDNRIKENSPVLIEIKRGMSVLKDNEWIIERLNPVIDDFIKTAEYRNIYLKWYGRPSPFWTVKKVFLLMSLIMTLMLIIFLAWKYYSTEKLVVQRTAALKNNEERMRVMFEQAPFGTALSDSLTGKIIEFNPKYEEIIGRKINELDIIDWMSITHPDDIKEDLENMNLLSRGEISGFSMEKRYIHSDGSIIWVDMTIKAVSSGDKNNPQYLCILNDITDWKKSEEAVKKSEDKYRHLVKTASEAVYLINDDGFVIDTNDSACSMLNRTEEEIKKLNISEIDINFPVDDFKAFWENIPLNEPHVFETVHQKSDGTRFPVEVSGQKFLMEGETVYYGVARDITKRREYEREKAFLTEQLNHKSRMDAIGQIASGVAHDFNNILSGIIGSAQLLQLKEKNLSEKGQKYINTILRASETASVLTNKLLLFSRKKELDKKVFDIKTVINEAVEILESTVDKKVSIKVVESEKDLFISGDSSSIQNVLINICINSSQAMPDGGEIRISTKLIHIDKSQKDSGFFESSPGDYVNIRIADDGCGIPEEYFNKIYDPFFTTKETGKGTGLGLATAYGIVKDHYGEIKMESQLDEGTVFNIYLPAAVSSEKSENIKSDISTGTGRILFVDDEEHNRELGRDILESLGYEVLLASDGLEACEFYKNNFEEIDLIILDYMMPKMNGKEAFCRIKEINKDCKIILASGYIENDDILEMREKGLSAEIHKPYTINELSTLLKNVMI